MEGAVFRGLCKLIDAEKTRTTPYHPQGDRQVERLNKSLVKILCKLISDYQRDWADVWQGSYFAIVFYPEVQNGTFTRVVADIPRLCCSVKTAVGGDSTTSKEDPKASAEISESLLRHQVPWSAVPCRRPGVVWYKS